MTGHGTQRSALDDKVVVVTQSVDSMISEAFSNLSDCVISKKRGHTGDGVLLHGNVTMLFICCAICCHN